jgi:protein-S-isoprenylcysteine O-methyltransferase Ste14
MGSLLVALQFALLAALAAVQVLSWPEQRPGWLAMALWAAAFGYAVAAVWANPPGNFNIHPRPKQGSRLITHGIYAWVRHPMYGALLLAAAAISVAAAPGLRLQAWGACLALLAVLTVKSMLEERWLAEREPDYIGYAKKTRRFLPGRF